MRTCNGDKYEICPDGDPVYDFQGIYITKVCDKCRVAKLSGYKPEVLSGYTQADIDEDIEPEEGFAVVSCEDGSDFLAMGRILLPEPKGF